MKMSSIPSVRDVSCFIQRACGLPYFLETHNYDKNCICPNHGTKSKIDKDILKYEAVSIATLALEISARVWQF